MQNWVTEFMEHFGYLSVFFLIMIENMFPPIPSEVILTFGGFMTTYTKMSVWGVIFCATAGSVAGAEILYGIGYLINQGTIEKIVNRWGHLLRLKVEDIHRARWWFQRYGYRAVFFCRMIPLIRSLISLPAGMSGMNKGYFLLWTVAGTLIWNTVLVYSGAWLAESWQDILGFIKLYSNIVYIILFVAVAAFFLIWFRKKDRE